MKPLILILAAVLGVATALPAVDAAWAQGRGRGAESRQERGYDRERRPERERAYSRERQERPRERQERDRGPERRAYEERPRDTRPALGYQRRERDERRSRRWDDDEPPRARGGRGYEDAPPSAGRRGFAAPAYRGPVVEDYRRYRLRPPPQGYAWVRMGDGFALISLYDGQIFDRVR